MGAKLTIPVPRGRDGDGQYYSVSKGKGGVNMLVIWSMPKLDNRDMYYPSRYGMSQAGVLRT